MSDEDRPREGGSPDDVTAVERAALPFDGPALLVTAAKASIGPEALVELLARVEGHLRTERERYARRYERVVDAPDRQIYLVPEGHWRDLGERLGLDRREWKAARRAHGEQLTRVGKDLNRREEFDSALDIREAVVVGVGAEDA